MLRFFALRGLRAHENVEMLYTGTGIEAAV